ncbi:MAG TPA: magnesium/cobalt transporter CorA [Acidimicrobiia bacterium]|nr:magnesium/cobalt transporter CorA [Acidimicrobiia bacterium]
MIRAWRYVAGRAGREEASVDHLHDGWDRHHMVLWIDAEGADKDQLHELKTQLGMGATVIDAILNPRERTKLMRYGDYFHVAVHDCECSRGVVSSREIDIVTGPGWLLTVRHPFDDGSQVDLDEVARRFELQRSEHSTTEQGFLLWAIFDVLVDGYFDVSDMVDERLDEIEDAVFVEPPAQGIPQRTFALRRELTTLRRAAAPMREVVNAIIRKEIDFVDEQAIVHFHDIYDRVLRVGDLVEAQRDLLTGLLEANLAVTSNQLNQVMKKMTSWGAILIVATLIAGIYGMNFRHMPELHWQYGYVMALGLMGITTFVLWRYFKGKNWL